MATNGKRKSDRDHKTEKTLLDQYMPAILIIVATLGGAIVICMLLSKLFGGVTKGIVG